MAKNFTYPRCPGKTFYQIFREAKVTAKTLGVSVDVTFNGTEVTIHEDSALADSQEILLLKERITRMQADHERRLLAH